MNRNKFIKLILSYVAGPAIFLVLLSSILDQLRQQQDWQASVSQCLDVLNGPGLFSLAAVAALMIVNWGLEARKWQLAMEPVARISFPRAFRAVLTGSTFAFFTPNRVGEYVGRMVYLQEGERLASVTRTVVCSLAQLLITLGAGLAGLLVFYKDLPAMRGGLVLPDAAWPLLLGGTAFSLLVLTFLYFRPASLAGWAAKIPMPRKWQELIRRSGMFNATILLRILSLSGARYAVFAAQYYLLFGVFEVETGWWQHFWAVSIVFLFIAIVPTIALLTELGVRWEAGVQVFGLLSANTAGILAASLVIWLINLVLPALAGSLLMLGRNPARKGGGLKLGRAAWKREPRGTGLSKMNMAEISE